MPIPEGFKLIAIQEWQNYLWLFRGWDAQGRPCHVDPRPAEAQTLSRFDCLTSRHYWYNAENAVIGNAAFLAFLDSKGIHYHEYKSPY